nr:MAG TPA: LAMINA-ASSOCIATED POLYPEPTIDE 2 PROTEIN, INNER NUCLEAR MEMBRANE [Caudoviricetes sp.]
MEYINKETLASIETGCELGGDWVPASELKEDYKLTVPEIKSKLDELGINYDSKAAKADLLDLLEQHEG